MPGAPIVGGPQPPLQGTGPIGLSDINNQFQRPWNSEISLRLAETGWYAGINVWSGAKPGAAAPASLSEWYGYYHAASMPMHNVTAAASLVAYISGGVQIRVVLSEGAAAAASFTVRVYWMNNMSGLLESSVYSGFNISVGSTLSNTVNCNAPGFTHDHYSQVVAGASPNPNYDQIYVF